MVLADTKSVIRDLKTLGSYGIRKVDFVFNPGDADYYVSLFREIRKQKIRLAATFDYCWPAEKAVITEFSRTFRSAHSSFNIYAECGAYRMRVKNKGLRYSDRHLITTLGLIKKKNFAVNLNFAVGLPGETSEDVVETLRLINSIRRRFPGIIQIHHLEFEPPAPRFVARDRFGVRGKAVRFIAYYTHHKRDRLLLRATSSFSLKELNAIHRLYEAEAQCRGTESRFLKALTVSGSGTAPGSFQALSLECRKCRQYRRCFLRPVDRRLN